jgi:hypothetical protein
LKLQPRRHNRLISENVCYHYIIRLVCLLGTSKLKENHTILHVVSYWSGTWSLALRQEHNVFDNSSPTLSKTLGSDSYTVTEWAINITRKFIICILHKKGISNKTGHGATWNRYCSKDEKHIYTILAKIKARTHTEDIRGNGNTLLMLLRGELKGGERVDRTEMNYNGVVSGSCEAEIKLWVP